MYVAKKGWAQPSRIVQGASTRTRTRKAAGMDVFWMRENLRSSFVDGLGTTLDLQAMKPVCGVAVSLCNADTQRRDALILRGSAVFVNRC